MATENKTILTPNFNVALLEFQEAVQEGWKLCTNTSPHAFIQYEIHLVKDVPDVVQEPVKRVGRAANK